MRVRIKETGEIKKLTLLTPDGDDWARDFISNYWSDIKWEEELSTYDCGAETFEFWHPLLAEFQNLYWRESRLKAEHGYDAVTVEAIEHAINMGSNYVEDEAALLHQAYDSVFGKDKITYYVAISDSTWSDSETELQHFREWAKKQIESKFPRYDVKVDESIESAVYTSDKEAKEKIEDFISKLADQWCSLPTQLEESINK